MTPATSTRRPALLHRARRAARQWISRARDRWEVARGDYFRWLAEHVAARQKRLKVHAGPGQFSFLTGVYEGTPPQLFRETADALFAQTSPEFEWVILAHGPIPESLQSVLQTVAQDQRVRLIELEENLGIIGGMRVCLEGATGEYVIPLDSDDLLFPDALQTCAQELTDHGQPLFLFSDEDHYNQGHPFAPFRRPAWDPVLNQASSYIWHLCAFQREAALQLGVYEDQQSNYCHDWDTVTRFALAGHQPHHTPEVIYHWRTHANSHTNRRTPHPGSLESQKHLLRRHIDAQPNPERYELRPSPIDRGSEEWSIHRKPIDPPTVDLIQYGKKERITDALSVYPFQQTRHCAEDFAKILARVNSSTAEYAVIMAENVALEEPEAIWEAVRLFEMNPDVALVAGRLADRSGKVSGDGETRLPNGGYHAPTMGRDLTTPGPFSLWLKPRCVDAVDPRFFIARVAEMQKILADWPQVPFTESGRRLSELVQQHDCRIATSPLIIGKCQTP